LYARTYTLPTGALLHIKGYDNVGWFQVEWQHLCHSATRSFANVSAFCAWLHDRRVEYRSTKSSNAPLSVEASAGGIVRAILEEQMEYLRRPLAKRATESVRGIVREGSW